jgi:hypothetical protein
MTQVGYVYDSTVYYRARYYDPRKILLLIGRGVVHDGIVEMLLSDDAFEFERERSLMQKIVRRYA